jgi:hypothetical protein
MAENRGAPGLDVVEVGPAIDVGDVRAPRSSDEEGVATDGTEGADRRVHARRELHEARGKRAPRFEGRSSTAGCDELGNLGGEVGEDEVRPGPL